MWVIVTRCEEDAHLPIGPESPVFMGRASPFARDLCNIRVDMTNGNAVVVKPNDEVTTSKPEAGQRERGVAFSRKMLHEGVQQKKIVVEFSRNWGSPCLFKEPDKP